MRILDDPRKRDAEYANLIDADSDIRLEEIFIRLKIRKVEYILYICTQNLYIRVDSQIITIVERGKYHYHVYSLFFFFSLRDEEQKKMRVRETQMVKKKKKKKTDVNIIYKPEI